MRETFELNADKSLGDLLLREDVHHHHQRNLWHDTLPRRTNRVGTVTVLTYDSTSHARACLLNELPITPVTDALELAADAGLIRTDGLEQPNLA